jgi:transposase
MNDINYAGIEVSKDELVVKMRGEYEAYSWKTYSNTTRGHKALSKYLTQSNRKARVVLEATGVYSLDLAILLSKSPDIGVMVLNPLQSHRFAQVLLHRSKNDKVDASMLLEFAERMEFQPFNPPVEKMYELRSIARSITSINAQCVRQKCMKHASTSTKTTSKAVLKSTKAIIRTLEREVKNLSDAAFELIKSIPDLKKNYDLVVTIPGIARASAIQILGEIAFYGEYLDCKKLVALAGLDPVELKSGKSKSVRIGISKRGSRYLRRALYMPALVARLRDPNVSAFGEHLKSSGKKPKQITVAIMRKLIHSISGVVKNEEPWIGDKFYRM